MKKIDLVLFIIILSSVFALIFYGFEVWKTQLPAQDQKEKEYLNMELKRGQINDAIKYFKENRLEEALLFLNQSSQENNPFGLYLKGHILFKMGRKKEGLDLIKEAIKKSPVLYDTNYPHNIRKALEEMLPEIIKDEKLNDFRHFLESKLKGGCG